MLHKKPGRTVLIACGSETGNAYGYAEELGRLVERLHFHAFVAKLDSIDILSLVEYTVVIIVVSTTGQGDLPANARSFWKSLLRKKIPFDFLSNVHFTSFGLGDRSYPRFNWAAKKVHKRVTQLGGAEFYPRGEADEQHEEGLDGTFLPWSQGLKEHLLRSFALDEGVVPIPEDTLLEPKWRLELVTDPPAAIESVDEAPTVDANKHLTADINNTNDIEKPTTNITPVHSISQEHFEVTLRENRRLTPDTHWQDVRHLTFAAQIPIAYGPGDVLTIYPQNSVESVNEIISMMNWDDVADAPIEFVPKTQQVFERYPPPPIVVHRDTKLTLRFLLANHLDINAIPRRSFFSLIAHFTEDQFQKDRLMEFTDPKYVDELHDYTTRPRRSLLEVLQEFESVKIPWRWAAYVLPELRGRQFSIASGGRLKNNADGTARFELLVAIVKYRTVIKKIREGACTRYLAHLKSGSHLTVSLQRGGLGISELDLRFPMIMIGPGTGVAPMRSLIWQRNLWAEHHDGAYASEEKNVANGSNEIKSTSLLIFGGRNQDADFFFKSEWDAFKEAGALEVMQAFSRDQVRKYYVQDAIRDNSGSIYRMLQFQNAIVYVCGSSGKMPTAVRAALVDVIQQHGGSSTGDLSGTKSLDHNSALRYLDTMDRVGRYKQETW